MLGEFPDSGVQGDWNGEHWKACRVPAASCGSQSSTVIQSETVWSPGSHGTQASPRPGRVLARLQCLPSQQMCPYQQMTTVPPDRWLKIK